MFYISPYDKKEVLLYLFIGYSTVCYKHFSILKQLIIFMYSYPSCLLLVLLSVGSRLSLRVVVGYCNLFVLLETELTVNLFI